MTQPLRLDLADYVRELTTRHTHREHYTTRRAGTWYGQDHVTTVAPLLDQLWASDTPSNAADDGPRAGYTSKPAARLEALDCLQGIEREVDWWITQVGGHRAGRDTAHAIRYLGSLAPALEACGKRRPGCCDRHELERDVRRWWTQARIVTGWDAAAWKPDNTCPMCGTRGSLRVKLAEQVAFCAECRETWTPENIGLLADHIRAESSTERAPRPERVACYCPIVLLPGPVVARPVLASRWRLCPHCGSPRCVHALEQAPGVEAS